MGLNIRQKVFKSSILFLIIASLAVLSLSACTKSGPQRIKGFLWEVKSGESTVYLYGSIHVGKSSMYPLDKTVEEAFENSTALGVEVNPLDILGPQESLRKYAYYSDGDNVYNHISEEGKKKLQSAAEEIGIPLEQFANLKPSALGSLVSAFQIQKAGYNPQDGIDYYFTHKAFVKNKKIVELEGHEFQSRLLYSEFTDMEQEESFILSLTSLEETKKAIDELYSMFIKGDEAGITEAVLEGDRESNFYKKLIVERNINMADKVEGFLKSGDTYFVVVGLGHYLGEDSVVRLLQDKGYTVKRR